MEPLEIKQIQYRVLEYLSPTILSDIENHEKEFERIDKLVELIDNGTIKTMYQCESNGYNLDVFEISILSIIDKPRGLVYGYEAGAGIHSYSKQYNLLFLKTKEELDNH